MAHRTQRSAVALFDLELHMLREVGDHQSKMALVAIGSSSKAME
jgi:hypothetical protein